MATVVAALKFGEIAAAPVQDSRAFVLPMRLDPTTVPAPPSVELGVPSPEHVDLEELLRRSTESQGFMRAELHQVNTAVSALATLRSEQVHALDEAAANLDAVSEREERARRFHVFLKEVENILGSESYARYFGAMQEHFDAFFVH
jgi:flavin reductase (DIM6/NTAB) family NADH-FMN oxidoreductase RutF